MCAYVCVFVKVSFRQMWKILILLLLKRNLIFSAKVWENLVSGTRPLLLCVFFHFPAFLFHSRFSFPTLQVKMSSCLDGLSIITILPLISSLSLSLPPSLPPVTRYGCQVIDGCVRHSHESCFYSKGLPYKPTAVLGYWANKLWASRKSISYIDKHRRTHECTYAHSQWDTDGGGHTLTHKRKHALGEQQTP